MLSDGLRQVFIQEIKNAWVPGAGPATLGTAKRALDELPPSELLEGTTNHIKTGYQVGIFMLKKELNELIKTHGEQFPLSFLISE
jgi:TusA-related sulfurtransferase